MEQLLKKIEELRQRYLEIKALLEIGRKDVRSRELKRQMSAPDFWDNQEEAIEISQEAEDLSSQVEKWNNIGKEIRELEEVSALANKEKDSSLLDDLEAKYLQLDKVLSKLEFNSLFSGEYDSNNAYISIHSGTGGVDAQDWAEMLERMFLRFCEKKGFKTKILEKSYGTEAGIKSCEIKVKGSYAYGYLKSENGTHRLLRNSPFNADGLRQTSFALVEVIPEIKSEKLSRLNDDDLRVDVYRSSGPGGQSVNTTDSAVRITHIPTGIVAACQSERSQHQNKEAAMEILHNRVNKLILEERERKEKDLKGDNKAEWGRQIRSYFLYGNRLAKDHRSNFETSDVDSVLDGDLEPFISAYLHIKE